MKILMLTVNSRVVITFREKLIKHMQSLGHEVHVVCGDSKYKEEIEKRNIKFYEAVLDNRSQNLFASYKYKNTIAKLAKKINPDIAMTFMLKPNTFGVMGLKKAGVKNVYSMIEGMGDVFINQGFKWTLIRKYVRYLYKKAFKYSKKVFVLNSKDKEYITNNNIVKEDKIIQINGIGIDVYDFNYVKPYNVNNYLMIARLLKTKGVIEYCKAAEIIKKNYPQCTFTLVGPEGNITREDIKYYIENGYINYIGPVNNVKPYIEECSIYVLPSYREGMPVSTQEAMAIGRGIITTNTAGCSDTVVEGLNGFICEVADYEGLASCIEKTIDNKDLVDKFGINSRKLVEEKFDIHIINKKVILIIKVD